MMKDKYTIEQDGFVRNIISVLFRTAFPKKYEMRHMLCGCYEDACNKARQDSMREALGFLEGRDQE